MSVRMIGKDTIDPAVQLSGVVRGIHHVQITLPVRRSRGEKIVGGSLSKGSRSVNRKHGGFRGGAGSLKIDWTAAAPLVG